MSEETKVSDGTGAKPDELQAQIEKLTEQLNGLTSERDEFKKKFEEAKTTRDKAKEERRKQLEAEGQYQEALKVIREEMEAFKSKLGGDPDSFLKKYEELQNAHTSMIEVRKSELLNQLPEDRREKYKEFSLDVLAAIVPDISQGAPATHKGGTKPPAVTDKKWDEMTAQERAEYTLAHGSEATAKKIRESGFRLS